MRKLITKSSITLITMIMVLLANSTNAQSGWQKVLAKPYNNYFTDVWFVSGDDNQWLTGWVVEYHGDIYKTEDGGDTWTMYTQSFSETLSTICFVDENTGYLCTYNTGSAEGKILKSTDGGETWVEQISDASYWFSSIRFKDEDNGVVSGNPNMYTNDGGVTWNEASPSGNEEYYYGYADYSAGDTYFAVELWNGKVGKSTDNGETWTNIYTEASLLPNYIDFYDGQHGMTGGSNERVLITHDGGDTWDLHDVADGNGDAACYGWFDPDTLWAAGSDIYKSTDGGENWSVDTIIGAGSHKDMFVTATNKIYVINDIITGENSLWRKEGYLPLVASFEANDSIICGGTTIDFTDLSYYNVSSWDWTFEGGTPSSSTDQNPTITYNTTGYYDVELTVSDGYRSETLTKSLYISVLETPTQAETPDGEANVCTDQYYSYSTLEVPYAQNYEWEISPSDAGSLEVDGFEASLLVDDNWTGDFTLRVRATNICGNGEWSGYLEGTVYLSPTEYNLQGGGSLCEGSEGVEITLDGSQTGIDYELYRDDETTGIIIEGTGTEISFGLVSESGFYTAIASNDNCIVPMAEQVEVTVLPLPSEPVLPTGPIAICEETTSDYSSEGGENADSYVWLLTPEEAGSISGEGLEAIVAWNSEFTGIATVSLAGINDCGEGNFSDSLEVAVGATIPEIIGADMVCDFSEEVYEVTDNEGSTYTWEVTGGSITEGQGTYMINVAWNGEGNGILNVDEENENGCEGSSENFEVVIDDCTDIDETAHTQLSLYPNPAKNKLYISYQSSADQDSKITIYNHLGQVAFKKEVVNKTKIITEEIDISSFTNGLYIVKVQLDNESIITKQLIKK